MPPNRWRRPTALFVEDVALALQGRELGDGLVARTCSDTGARQICRAAGMRANTGGEDLMPV
jgi:hypothetical protein